MKKKLSQTTKIFLEICRGVGDLIETTASFPTTLMQTRALMTRRRSLAIKKRQTYAITELRKQQLIRTKMTSNGQVISLTKQGIAKALVYCITYHPRPLPDGWVCIVVFDIPESKRILRQAFRQLLRNLKFTPLQKSVWIARHDAAQHLREYSKLAGLNRWIKIFIATESDSRGK